MKKVSWISTAILTIIGIAMTYKGVSHAESAIQEVDAISLGLAFAIIPYILTRAVCGIVDEMERENVANPAISQPIKEETKQS